MAVSKKRRTTRKRKRKNVNTSAVKIGPKPKRRRQNSAPNSNDSSLPNTAKLEDEQNQSAKLDDKKSKESSPVTSTSKVMSKKNPQGRPAQSTSPQTSPQLSQLENNVDVSSDDEESVHSETSQTESTSSIPSVIQSESPSVIPLGPRLDSYRRSPDFDSWIGRRPDRYQPINWDERDDLIGCHHDSKVEVPLMPKPINVDVRASKPQPSICYMLMRSWCFMIQLIVAIGICIVAYAAAQAACEEVLSTPVWLTFPRTTTERVRICKHGFCTWKTTTRTKTPPPKWLRNICQRVILD